MSRFAAGFLAFVFLLLAASVAFDPVTVPLALLSISFATVGALVASRRPDNRIGWIFCFVGLAWAVGAYGDASDKHPSLADPVSSFNFSGGWVLSVGPAATLMLLLFPDGRLVSPRWRPVAWLSAVSIVAVAIGISLSDAGNAPQWAFVVPLIGLFVSAVASVASLVLRFRRSRGLERQQLKWFMSAGALAIAVWLLAIPEWAFAEVLRGAFLLSLSLIPIAAGIAILRYRLYDIDVVINRTLVYGALTATLAISYLATVLLLQLLLRPLTSSSNLAIAGSTLAVAALFGPARRRIQEVVDRRFYRRKYDAAQTLERFGARLRDEVALDSLSAELRGVVAETMQPAHVSLWLRAPEARR